MSLNQELIRGRCREIMESLERLDRIAKEPKDTFVHNHNQDLQDIACYRLLVAIESALSLCYHIAAKQLQKVPEEYAECFAILADAGIIPAALSTELQKMARFRNLLVHMYWKIDYHAVYDILQDNLDDLSSFSSIIAGLL